MLKKTLVALLAGVVVGFAAFCLKKLIALVSGLATAGFRADHENWWMIPLGVAAIVVSAWLVRKVVRMPLEHATARMRADLAAGRAPLPARIIIAPIAANALTLGLGGSAGAEGPIAYSGAAIASRFARWFGLSHADELLFLACGAGAGIAAIFKAPLGGFFFVFEVLAFSMSAAQLSLLAAICLSAGLSAFAIGGFTPGVCFSAFVPFELKWYPLALLLGLFCGVYARYYAAVGNWMAARLAAVSRPVVRNSIAGLALGLLLFLFPSLYGEGYGVLATVLNGNAAVVCDGTFAHGLGGTPLLAAVLAGIVLVKSFATYATNSGGGVAGEFAPTIFAGGMFGALFAVGAGALPALSAAPSGDLILIAMAAVMAGVIKAPLMAIFIVVEMTQCYQMLLPVALASGISFAVAKIQLFSKTKHLHSAL